LKAYRNKKNFEGDEPLVSATLWVAFAFLGDYCVGNIKNKNVREVRR
jgi:hypothetical protein